MEDRLQMLLDLVQKVDERYGQKGDAPLILMRSNQQWQAGFVWPAVDAAERPELPNRPRFDSLESALEELVLSWKRWGF